MGNSGHRRPHLKALASVPALESMMAEQLRILLVDDNVAVLHYVLQLLPSDCELVGTLSDSKLVVQQVPVLRPDLIILDITMGEVNGFDVARQLRVAHCSSKIVFLTVHQEFEFIQAAFDAGAAGYVFKSRLRNDLPAAINAVRNGKIFLSADNGSFGAGAGRP